MSLTLPTNYENATQLNNINENWIVQLYYGDETNFTGISLKDTIVNSIEYEGIITNVPAIRNSINVFESTADSGNITLNIINRVKKVGNADKKLSETLHTKIVNEDIYINRKIKVYSQINNDSNLSNCLLLFEGKIKTIAHSLTNLTLTAINNNVYDDIELLKTTSNGVVIPLAFGKFAEHSSINDSYFGLGYTGDLDNITSTTGLPINSQILKTSNISGSDKFTSYALRPAFLAIKDMNEDISTIEENTDEIEENEHLVNSNQLRNTRVSYIVGPDAVNASFVSNEQTEATKKPSFFIYDNCYNKFLPIWTYGKDYGNGYSGVYNDYDTFEVESGAYALWTDIGFRRGFFIRPHTIEPVSSNNGYNSFGRTVTIEEDNNNPLSNAIDSDTTTYAQIDFSVTSTSFISYGYYKFKIRLKPPSGQISQVTDEGFKSDVVLRYKYTGTNTHLFKIYVKNMDSSVIYQTGNDTTIKLRPINVNFGVQDIELMIRVSADQSTTNVGNFKLYDIYWNCEYANSYKEVDGVIEYNDSPEKIYTALDGVSKLNNITPGVNNTIENILDAHRELLFRYTDIGNSAPINYDQLLDRRKFWHIRDSIHEETTLKEKLEQYQKEGCFIYTEENNQPKYIFIKPAYDSTDIIFNFKDSDYKNLNITLTDNYYTKFILDYQKHPATGNYKYKINVNTSDKSHWGYGITNENCKSFKLDALVRQARYYTPENEDYINFDGNIYHAHGIGLYNANGTIQSNMTIDNGFLNYMVKLMHRPRTIINLELLNPKFYKLQCGDIVSFDSLNYDINNKFYNETLSNYPFMIIDISKKINNIKIKLLEIGS